MKTIKCEFGEGTAEEIARRFVECHLEDIWRIYAYDGLTFDDCTMEEEQAIEEAVFNLRVVIPEEVTNQ